MGRIWFLLRGLIYMDSMYSPMTAAGRLSTINLHESTLRVLRSLMDGKRRSYEDVILSLIDAHPPAAYLKELERRIREEKSYPAEAVYHEAGLL